MSGLQSNLPPSGPPEPLKPPRPPFPLEQVVRTNIPGNNPGGSDPAYDDDFLRIKAEIDRLAAASGKVDQQKVIENTKELENIKSIRDDKERTAALEAMRQRSSLMDSGGPDFRLVIELATRILAEKSKDLRVACYLCLALWRLKRSAGLAEGLSVILVLVREHWDTMFPAKARIAARKAALDFLLQHAGEGLRESDMSAEDRACLEQAKTLLASLEEELRGRMAENAPAVITVTRAVEEAIARLPKPAAPAPRPPVEPSPSAGSAQPAAPSPGEGEPRSLPAAFDLIRKTASYLRGVDRKSIPPYRLIRSMRWDMLLHDPPNENGRTKIEPPPAQRRTYLEGLRQQGQWEKLLEEGESTFPQHPFHLWLDLQQLVVSALETLGPEYAPVSAAIQQDLTALHGRVPGLASLQFNDGTPFASPATRSWLQEILRAAAGGEKQPPSPPDDSPRAAAIAAAKKSVDRGELGNAIALLQNLPLPPRSRRAQFERRLDIALLCVRGNQLAMARPILEELSEEIDRCGLMEWDPSLALETWKALERCYLSLAAGAPAGTKQSLTEQAGKVFEKICRLDVGSALAMRGEPERR